MKNVEISRQIDKIDDLFKKASSISSLDIEILGHWAKYLCILVSGFMENSISEVFSKFLKEQASPPISKFSKNILDKIQNPKAYKFIEVTSAFNDDWGKSLKSFLDEDNERRRNALDAIMTNRHLIAHGKSSTISMVQVKEYYSRCIEIIEFIENLIER